MTIIESLNSHCASIASRFCYDKKENVAFYLRAEVLFLFQFSFTCGNQSE